MREVSLLWIFVAVAAVLDAIGLFFLWRRRSSSVAGYHRLRPAGSGRLQIMRADRRRKERRRAGRVASA